MCFFNIRNLFLMILCILSASVSAEVCPLGFSFTHDGFVSSIMDVKKRAEANLGRTLKEEEVKAIYQANSAYSFLSIMNNMPINFLLNKESKAVELGNNILQDAGFPKHEIQALRRDHIVGLSYDVGDSLLFHRHFVSGDIKGQNSWFMYEDRVGSMIVGRMVKKIDENSLLAEIVDYESGQIRRRKIILDSSRGEIRYPPVYSRTGHVYPRSRNEQTVKPIFQALKSKKERLTVEEMGLGQRKQPDLPDGYGAIYTRGWHEINKLVEVGRRLKELKINPNKTHIDYFAGQIRRYVNYMREGILSRKDISDEQKQKYLAKLEVLENEGKLAIHKKEVTYSWWLQFNSDLSRVNEEYSRSGKKWGVEIAFPSVIVLPTIAGEGEIGIMAMNRAFPEGIYPIGLTNKVRTVDGQTMTPRDFYEHDMFHAEINAKLSHYTGDIKLFYSRFVKLVEDFPMEKRKNVEFAYFVLFHEIGQNFINFHENRLHSFYVGNMLNTAIQALMKESLLPSVLSVLMKNEEQRKAVVDDFVEVFHQIRN